LEHASAVVAQQFIVAATAISQPLSPAALECLLPRFAVAKAGDQIVSLRYLTTPRFTAAAVRTFQKSGFTPANQIPNVVLMSLGA
jgi:hypothetical protein